MSTLIEDSPRPNLATWIIEATKGGYADGGVITPFATPWPRLSAGMKPPATEWAERLHVENCEVWFDATTHALDMAGVGDFRFYSEYSLWAGGQGDLSDAAAMEDHVRRVFNVQDELGSKHLGPTILLHHGLSTSSVRALRLAEECVKQDSNCWLSIAGPSSFWASREALDAHVGSLAQMEPSGWFLTVVRDVSLVPAEPTAEEVHGLCRTARALSDGAGVHVSHGDLAALPAVAAGAASVGSGWDKRQRVCATPDYAARELGGSGGGGWYERPTLGGLVGSLSKREAEVLGATDSARATRLGYTPTPGAKEAFLQHIATLSAHVDRLSSENDPRRRYELLMNAYDDATSEWPQVQRISGCAGGAERWIKPFAEGLRLYGATEGWTA